MQKAAKLFLISLIQIIVLLFGLPIVSAGAGVDKKVTDLFKVNWESIRYDKSVYRRNPEFTLNDPSVRENLSLSGRIEIKDPNLVLGTCQQGIITEMTDHKGQKIDHSQELPRRMYYEGLRYNQRYIQPQLLPRWKTVIRSLLRTGPTSSRPELVNELQPARLEIQMNIRLLETPGGEIGSLKGYFYIIIAESLKYIDVPFEPNDNWVRLTDDMEVHVREAKCTTTSASRSRYSFDIEENWTGGPRTNRLSIEDYLPERIVTGRQFIGVDGKPTQHFMGMQSLPAHVAGSGYISGSDIQIKKIRFVIALNPSHYKVPFEFKNIPLPDPELRQEKKDNNQ
jgi:hypothetical protein